jgi:hypothetical protein
MANRGSRKLEMKGKRLHDEVVSLKTAIEGAINRGQKSLDDLKDIHGSGLVSNKEFALICVNSSLMIID